MSDQETSLLQEAPTPQPVVPSQTPPLIVGSTPPSGGNIMQKIKLLLILIPILVLLVIVIFVTTSFLGKPRSGKSTKVSPTISTASTVQLPSLPPISPGGFTQSPTPTPKEATQPAQPKYRNPFQPLP